MPRTPQGANCDSSRLNLSPELVRCELPLLDLLQSAYSLQLTLQGTAGSKLLQGPNGMQLIDNIPGASYIENTVVAVGSDFASIHFQNVGVFYSLNASTVGSPLLPLYGRSGS